MRKSRNLWLWLSLAALLAMQLYALALYSREQRYLANLMAGIASPSLPADAQAKQILPFLRRKPVITNDSYFLLPVFGFLRATPRQVAEQGGDCSDRSRLMIALLHLRGVSASKWALYTPEMQPKHAVVEIETPQGKMVVDPLFGLWYPRPEGGYYGIEELRRDPSPFQQRILELRARHERPGAVKLEEYPLDRYIYRNARTFNWDKSSATRLLYGPMRGLLGERADRIPRPEWAEEPALSVAIGLGSAEAVLLIFGILVIRSRNRKRSATHAQEELRRSHAASASAAGDPAGLGRLPRI